MQNQEPNIFSYNDFRQYLEDYVEFCKARSARKISYRNISRMAGFQAPNYVSLVVSGKRNLGKNSISKIAKAVKLSGKKLHYFENLVLFNQASTSSEKETYYKKLTDYKKTKAAQNISSWQSEYLKKWHYPVIREMVKMTGFQADPKWIAKHIVPSIKIEHASEAWALLKKLGLVEQDEDGVWQQSYPSITTDTEENNEGIIQYHSNMIRLGHNSLNLPYQNREVRGMTVSISEAKKQLICQKIDQLQEEVQRILFEESAQIVQDACDQTSQVYQLNVQFFPLAKQEDMS